MRTNSKTTPSKKSVRSTTAAQPFKRVAYPELCAHQLLTQQAKKTPDAIAIIDGNKTITFRELDAKTDRLAAALQQAGVGPEVIVGCYLSRSSAVVICMLSILKAGGAYLLLDSQLPDQRLSFMIADAAPRLILADIPFPASVEHAAAPVHDLQAMQQRIKGKVPPLKQEVKPDNVAYIAYTSGSTGQPKGVIITHRSTVNHTCSVKEIFKLVPSDRVPLMAPIAFDVVTEEVVPPLLIGATLIVSKASHTDMAEFTSEIVREHYTILNIPTPMWHTWVEYLATNHIPIPPSLRLVLAASEKILTKVFAVWKQLENAEKVQWVAAYGTTETTVTSTFYLTAWDDDLSDQPNMPIGLPIANTALYILDEKGQPVPDFGVGEIYIAGDGVARGYQNLPDKTASVFLPDPFSPEPGARMYKTGDQGRLLPSGVFACLGRKDYQVKINGLRIELGEVETVLSACPGVREGVVVVRQLDDFEESRQLVAYYTTSARKKVTPAELKKFASARLHPQMVPSEFCHLPEFPLTVNEKVDRKALERQANDGS
ncbi:MAG TPA: amino acid adenylation domain-containing protein [Candidatus Saccharimonadales bacterium]|nr:amino acid adenylation domain-containing protein [Candidatus Saccharimonadales bacterium]